MSLASVLDAIATARTKDERPKLIAAELASADLRDADLRGCDLYRADLRRADLAGANLTGTVLRRADLAGANLTGADLRRAALTHANLRGANLHDSDLHAADLYGANLTGANLSWTRLAGTWWSGMALTGLPSGDVLFVPTPNGWVLHVGCWTGDVDGLRAIANSDDLDDWLEAAGHDDIAERRPGLLLLADLCDDHAARHSNVITDLAVWWGSEKIEAGRRELAS